MVFRISKTPAGKFIVSEGINISFPQGGFGECVDMVADGSGADPWWQNLDTAEEVETFATELKDSRRMAAVDRH